MMDFFQSLDPEEVIYDLEDLCKKGLVEKTIDENGEERYRLNEYGKMIAGIMDDAENN